MCRGKSGDKAVGLISIEFEARVMFEIKPVFVLFDEVLRVAAASVKRDDFLRGHIGVGNVCDKGVVVVAWRGQTGEPTGDLVSRL